MPRRQGIGVQTAIGDRPHRIRVQTPGAAVPDGDGGYTTSMTDLDPPELSARIAPASIADLEQLGGGTVSAMATHLVTMPFHPGITTQTVIAFWTPERTRSFNVLGLANPDERRTELIAVCAEQVP